MAEELLDIVDENNKLIGQSAPRSQIHAEGIWHRTVHIYLFRKIKDQLEFLVHLRSTSKDLYPNCWDTRFGGHIKAGYEIEAGAKSELKEEIGLNIDNYELLLGQWVKLNDYPNCEFTKNYFLEYPGSVSDLKFNDGEVQEVGWMDIEEIKKSMTKDSQNWAASLSGFVEISNFLLNKLNI